MIKNIWTDEKFPQYAIDEVENTVTTILDLCGDTTDRLGIIRSFIKSASNESLIRGGWHNDTSLRYAVSQLPESERESYYPVEKSEPKFDIKVKPAGEWNRCSKCGGNGKFIMWIENGVAHSTTGTTCYKCNGKGWIAKKIRK